MIRTVALASLSALVAGVYAQQVGTQLAETHPKLTWSTCSAGGSCTTTSAPVVLDANWRWLHTTSGYTNCYTGNAWDATLCPNPTTCAANCALDGADYSGTYGITTSGNALTLKFKTGSNVGSRTYLMASDTAYQMFKLKNREFTFDVDMSQLGCGLNGALYFSEMAADGGLAKYSGNKAGAKYGTGYCDSQCPHDLKFINGEANTIDWGGSSGNSGNGHYGACCNEMDIWEANKFASAYTPHGCTVAGPYRCEGTECGDGDNRHGGVCDKDGCDFNSYRLGDKTFLGVGKTIDTTKKITVITQFLTVGNSDSGALREIRRVYMQNGVVIQNSKVNVPGMAAYDSITTEFCSAQKTAFGDVNDFANKGGFTPMDKAMTSGMVLVMSVWDDYAVGMLWLDSTFPTDADPNAPGIARGECPTTSGVPADVESQQPNAYVIYSNIKFGPIGSTYPSTGTSSTVGSTARTTSSSVRTTSSSVRTTSSSVRTTSTTSVRSSSSSVRTTSTSTANGATQTHYGQCGGIGYSGPTSCASPWTCKYSNDWYSQCL